MNPVLFSTDWESSCDHCRYQEEGGHYCLLHSMQVKNMDVLKCKDWEERLKDTTVTLKKPLGE